MTRNSPLSSSSRRAFLGGLATVAGVQGLPAVTASPPTLTVMTRNLYLGVDLFELYDAEPEELTAVAGDLFAQFERHPFDERMDAIAREIEAAEVDIVGLQEGAVVRAYEDDEPIMEIDLLATLIASLAERGLTYDPVVLTETNDVETPVDLEDRSQANVAVTDRVGLLAREGIDVAATDGRTFDAAATPIDDVPFSIDRGYCSATIEHEDAVVTVATTHLESTDSGVRIAQVHELVDALSSEGPVVLAGDFNSGPHAATDAYELLRETFDDAHAAVSPEADGFTCCHPADLRGEEVTLDRRIDGVLYRGGVEPTAVDRVGADPADRFTVEWDGASVDIWPSDHAGAVATFEILAPAEGITPSPAAEPTPGMSVVGGALGLAGGAYLLARRRNRFSSEE